jgi:hypothetical protein
VLDDQSLKMSLRSHAIAAHEVQFGEPDERVLGSRREGVLDHDP